jgi:WD40 repeat protein
MSASYRLFLTVSLWAAANPAAAAGPGTDAFGDPLPTGAVARLGTVRLRSWGRLPVGLAFSADGKTLTALEPEAIRRWEVPGGKALPPYRTGAPALFAPDGKSLISNEDVNRLCLWAADTGKHLRDIQINIEGWGMAVSADGKMLASAGYKDGTIRLWDTATAKVVRTVAADQASGCGLWFSRDGRLLVSGGSDDQPIRVWDVATGKVVCRTDTTGVVSLPALSPDGRLLAASFQRAPYPVRLWDVATGKAVGSLEGPRGLPEGAATLAFAPDGKTLATLAGDAVVRLWDTTTRRELRRFTLAAKIGKDNRTPWLVGAAAFAPDGKTLAAGNGNAIRLWDPATGEEIGKRDAHTDAVTCLAISPDGKSVASGGVDDTIRLWDAATGRQRRRLDGHAGRVESLAFSPDGRLLISASADETLRLWDVAAGREVRQMEGHAGQFRWVAFLPDGKSVLSWSEDEGMVRVWDAETGRQRREIACEDPREGKSLALSPDGRLLAAPSGLWDVATGEKRPSADAGDRWATFSGDGRTLATVAVNRFVPPGVLPKGVSPPKPDAERSIRLWEVATGRPRARLLRHKNGGPCMALSPDGRTLASGDSLQHHIHLWNAPTARLMSILSGHTGPITALAFTPDGSRLVSASHDTTLLVWDVAAVRRAEALSEPAAEELEAAWEDLAGKDAGRAYLAVWTLAQAPAAALPLLAKRLRPVAALDADRQKRLGQLLADLDAEEFAVRERAAAELVKLGEAARPRLRQVLEAQPPPELRRRATAVLEKLGGASWSSEELRAMRAVEALEHMRTPEARARLEKLAAGAPEAMLTREAKTALKRLGRRPD